MIVVDIVIPQGNQRDRQTDGLHKDNKWTGSEKEILLLIS